MWSRILSKLPARIRLAHLAFREEDVALSATGQLIVRLARAWWARPHGEAQLLSECLVIIKTQPRVRQERRWQQSRAYEQLKCRSVSFVKYNRVFSYTSL